MLEVNLVSMAVLWSPEVTEMSTKSSPTPLQKHSLGGDTIDMPCRNAIGQGHRVSTRENLLSGNLK